MHSYYMCKLFLDRKYTQRFFHECNANFVMRSPWEGVFEDSLQEGNLRYFFMKLCDSTSESFISTGVLKIFIRII